MSRTFEELVGERLDALYEGALFLTGGDPRAAEHLLVDTVTTAFDEHARDGEATSVERWFEARLVRAFVSRVTKSMAPRSADAERRLGLDPASFAGLGAEHLYAAAAALPAWPRAALWLVLLRRWSYADAATVMGIDAEHIPDLLSHRDVLVREMLASSQTGSPGLEMGS